MAHVGLDKMTGGEGRAEGQFPGEHGGGDNARELARVVAGIYARGPAHAEEVEHSGLRLEDGPAADCADFN